MGKLKNKTYKKSYYKESHNCYSYFLNQIDKKNERDCKKIKSIGKHIQCWRPQPGAASGKPDMKKSKRRGQYTCKNIINRTLADNKTIYRTTKNNKCKKYYYKGALFIDPGRDFHYYREDKPGQWSHKQGYHTPSYVDAKGKRIKDAEKAAKKYKSRAKDNIYDKLCSYFCIPRNTRKRMKPYRKRRGKHNGFWELFRRTRMRSRRRSRRRPRRRRS